MSEKTITVCDCPGCKETTDDFYKTPGWIQLRARGNSINSGGFDISIARGRDSDGRPRGAGVYLGAVVLHFCCLSCYMNFINDLVEKAQKSELKVSSSAAGITQSNTPWPHGLISQSGSDIIGSIELRDLCLPTGRIPPGMLVPSPDGSLDPAFMKEMSKILGNIGLRIVKFQ